LALVQKLRLPSAAVMPQLARLAETLSGTPAASGKAAAPLAFTKVKKSPPLVTRLWV
jgi:hypothetical protein